MSSATKRCRKSTQPFVPKNLCPFNRNLRKIMHDLDDLALKNVDSVVGKE